MEQLAGARCLEELSVEDPEGFLRFCLSVLPNSVAVDLDLVMVATEMLTELTFNNLSLAEQADFENCDLDTEFAPELVEYLLDKLRPASPATLSAPLLKQLVVAGCRTRRSSSGTV